MSLMMKRLAVRAFGRFVPSCTGFLKKSVTKSVTNSTTNCGYAIDMETANLIQGFSSRQSHREMSVRTKRIYEPIKSADGTRILVDRLWPRGVSKEDAALDRWIKDIAPSDELRRYFPSGFLFAFNFRSYRVSDGHTAFRSDVRGTLTGVSVPRQRANETLRGSCCSVPGGPAA